MPDTPQQPQQMQQPRSVELARALGIPFAILIGFALIAVAIYFTGQPSPQDTTGTENGQDSAEVAGELAALNPVTDDDHIRGNPNAPVVFIEYSDYDCPFCKQYHETMKRIMRDYGASGQVAWVYRHFPLEQLHPSAARIAEAAECVADLGGNEAFWTFSDLVFEERGVNEPTDLSRLDEFATTAGVDVTAFNTCLDNGEKAGAVSEDYNNAVAIGGRGTPHTIVIAGDEQGVINGAQSYATVRQIVESILGNTEEASE